ncbi:hypothetical protein LOD99_16004 [Oopsacas minuta]|uniref:C2H2-type domain-containing protein n=1 Tax=Oopsacas minuta TaxID=111878 RepID=A0AAV7K6T4_9METZ|nr:hypothetical protein LOD99_16004 [Oopsacas minuta]
MTDILDFGKCRPLKPPKSVLLPFQPSRPISLIKYRHICAICHFRYTKKSDLTLHTKVRHNPTFKKSGTFQRTTWGRREYCPMCNYIGNNRIQLCEHSKNSHPLELIKLMVSTLDEERREFVYLSSAYYNKKKDRIMIYRLERDIRKVLTELNTKSTNIDREYDVRPIMVYRRGDKVTLPEVAEVSKKETETETIEDFDTLF